MTADDQADLIRRLASGDTAALEEAYRMHAGRCNAIAYRVLHDDAAAQDAVQDAFFSLWRHRDGLVVRSAGIGPWLVVVTRNAALAMLRSGQARIAREERVSAPVDTPSKTGGADPFERADAREQAGRVRQAVAQLPAEQRDVIEMAYFRFLTMSQIAQATGTPVGTVKRRAQSALRGLGSLLEETTP
jgi:RNA polymerase sigma-70 factor, ECF subfamily